MSQPRDPGARRRQRGASGGDGTDIVAGSNAIAGSADSPRPTPSGGGRSGQRPGRSRRSRAERDPSEAALRDLVGAGPSQLGVDAALRARDVNRPNATDLAVAEAQLVLVRRHWTPPT